MRIVVLVGLLAGCRQLLGIDPVGLRADASPGDAAGSDAATFDTACPDSDGDGVCDATDTWPCGAEPGLPASTVAVTGNGTLTMLVISATSIAAGGLHAVVTPGAKTQYTFQFDIHDTSCASNCTDQIEIGFAPGDRVGCPFDASVSKTAGVTGTISDNFDVPTVAGVYDVRVNIGQNFSCTYGGATTWWFQAPPAANTIARLCVH